ncbi:hypothetical protein BS47DRAFT_820848 [Hydnum rufescens UP504]|uniref:Polysaccharide biosynthesis domain-containing protein n=1 Tax=Hydnum rufescens UP504 TaxID=1448309 RepID=A0A9P6AZQ8_9AGAM|nr:hypothetical protein BS47DRAFT_820848 [Hydnum rufescens UP504]
MSILPVNKFDPNKAENHEDIEKQFAVVAVKHAQIYWGLLEKINPRLIRLTQIDDEIFADFQSQFPELFYNTETLAVIDEDNMKNARNKARWRNFIQAYQQKVQDYNFGSLLRTNSRGEYGEENTIFVTRMQFLAVEIARNRLGLNDEAHANAKAEK